MLVSANELIDLKIRLQAKSFKNGKEKQFFYLDFNKEEIEANPTFKIEHVYELPFEAAVQYIEIG